MKISLKRLILLVGTGSVLSKLVGMVRKITIAAYFGVSPAYDAFTYAYLIPNFFLIIIGGFNGPFHNAMVSTLANKNKIESQKIFSSINTIVGLFLLVISLSLFFYADFFISITAPGLSTEVKSMSIAQLKIMTPIVFISGLIGFSMGFLNNKGEFFITSITPIISNLVVVLLLLFLLFAGVFDFSDYSSNYINGIYLSIFTLLGAIFTVIIQIPNLRKKGLSIFDLNWELDPNIINKISKLFIPASITSGMLLLNLMTDRFFVSGFNGASAAITYSTALIQAPIGIISNSLLVPLLPAYASLYENKDFVNLKKRIREILVYSCFSMMCIGSLFIVLNSEIVSFVYGRGGFDTNATNLVGNFLFWLSLGMPFYLMREVLVRIFYGFSDARTPFIISSSAFIINVFLDWIMIGAPFPYGKLLSINYGAEGVVFATSIVNALSSIALIIKLPERITKINYGEWLIDFVKLLISFSLAIFSILLLNMLYDFSENMWGFFFNISISFLVSTITFFTVSRFANLKESKELIFLIKRKLIKNIK